MGSAVILADVELFLTEWFRGRISARGETYCRNVVVDNKEPDPSVPFPGRLVVIRFDGATRTSVATSEGSIGISILAGTKLTPQDANDLARMVLALSSDLPDTDPANPVAALLGSTGPISVPESQDRARRYLTLTLGLAGTPL